MAQDAESDGQDEEGRVRFTTRDRDRQIRLALVDYAQAYRDLADELRAYL